MFKCLIVKSSINRSFSIAMRNCQRVSSRIIQQANTRVTRHLRYLRLALCGSQASWLMLGVAGGVRIETYFVCCYIYI